MVVSDYFQRELSLINPNYFAVCNHYLNRYEIRSWDAEGEISSDAHLYGVYSKKSWLRLRVSVRNEDDEDIGFKPLDQRVLFALKKSEKESEDPERILREVDEANRLNEEKIDRNLDEHFRGMATEIWKFCRTITIDQGGTKW